MSEIKVETDELTAFANNYQILIDNFKKVSSDIITKTTSFQDVWKGEFSKDLSDGVKNLKSVKSNIETNGDELVKFVKAAVQKYTDVDRKLADASSIGNEDYPSNVRVSVHVKNSGELSKTYSDATARAKQMQHNPNGSISCAAMAKSKALVNGFNADWYGNGNQVYGNITAGEHSNFTATKYPGNNCLKDMINAEGQPITDIVISFPKSPTYGNKYGHVIYIDQIVDGKVYYSDNWGNTVNGVVAVSIDDFLAKYNRYGNGSPIGCVHLKKK